MHALKHPFWVLYWQLVGAVHPDGSLVGARGETLPIVKICVCIGMSELYIDIMYVEQSCLLPCCVCECLTDGHGVCQALPGG